MPVLAKFQGIVIRVLFHRTFGSHIHAIYGEAEMVIALNPTRVIQGEVPEWVKRFAFRWIHDHAEDIPVASEFGSRAGLHVAGGYRPGATALTPAGLQAATPAPRLSLALAF